ncbi:MAG: ROK family protein [Chloroflexia bacterium]|nr:ROK family protein [Chloroflexia bacterium]
MSKQIAIGADIGGSHISCAAIDLESHEVVENTYTVEEVNNRAEADVIINKWCTAIKETVKKAGVEEPVGIGFAMPGPFDYVNGIGLFEGLNEKFENLNRVNVGEKLKEALNYENEVFIRFMNDATAFAVGSVWADYALSNKNVLAITLGTGFGSAFIENTVPILTGEKVPQLGCLYHLPYRNGIADDTFSTRGLIKTFKEKTGVELNGVKEIAETASYDGNAAVTFKQFGENLADFLSPWIKKAGVDTLIIGGNISKAHVLFEEPLAVKLKHMVTNPI